jgi:hypothetical protein
MISYFESTLTYIDSKAIMTVNKETIDEIEQLAKESGGVFFICILD